MIFQVDDFIGEIAALSAALLWAISSIIYSRLGLKIPPLKLNFYKGIIAIAFILITLTIQNAALTNLSLNTIALLFLSGIIGIGLGDTAYFAALNSIGARRTLLLETSSPAMGALLALAFIGEQLSYGAWCGILLTILGIAWVINERSPVNNFTVSRNGIIWGILAAIAQAIGSVVSRFALIQSNISPLESTLIRLLGGTLIVFGLLFLPTNNRQMQIKWQLTARSLGIIAIAAFGSTYLGIWLQQTALKFSPTGIAQTLLATSPLFILPIVALQGEKISLRAVLGVLLSLGGISFMFLR
ncbi:DMT family transporter [Pleurocapsa sp. PCC 7319]|uniref:DMT family transporter n=1 Tax=Pleurocapsa sp. PCC 7319 TaxID=118161 RepID=UPI0003493752|nr:DMT family transporter [Pleurocapsa sp. PCC 7319]